MSAAHQLRSNMKGRARSGERWQIRKKELDERETEDRKEEREKQIKKEENEKRALVEEER